MCPFETCTDQNQCHWCVLIFDNGKLLLFNRSESICYKSEYNYRPNVCLTTKKQYSQMLQKNMKVTNIIIVFNFGISGIKQCGVENNVLWSYIIFP